MNMWHRLLELLGGGVARLARYFRRPAPPGHGRMVTTLIADSINDRVIEVTSDKTIVWQYGTAGAPGSEDNRLAAPSDAKRLADGNTLIADSGNHRVIEVSPDKRVAWQYGSAVNSEPDWLQYPYAGSRLANGNTLIVDSETHRVIEVDASRAIVWQYGMTGYGGSGENQLNNPHDANRLANGNTLIVDTGAHRVIEVDASKAIVWQYGTTGIFGSGQDQLLLPNAASRLASGNSLIADTGNDRVIEVSLTKTLVWQYSATRLDPSDAKRLPNGNTLITSWSDSRVIEVDPDGTLVWQYGTTGVSGSGENELNGPREASRLGTAVVQPDLMVRNLQLNVDGQPRDSTYIGAGIQNLDAANQTTDLGWGTPRAAVPFALKLLNEGNVTDRFAVGATASESPDLEALYPGAYTGGWRVRYFDALSGGTDITEQITGSGWMSPLLEAGRSIEFRAEVTNLARGSGEEIHVLVTAASVTDPTKGDAVKLRVKAPIIK